MARPTLLTHRKFLKLATRLQSPALALGHLELMWHSANETGEPILGDQDDVESSAQWRGARGELVAALIECGTAGGGAGFIERRPDGRYEIHDYWHHAPDYVRKRARREHSRRESGSELKRANDRSTTGHLCISDRSVTGPEGGDQSVTGHGPVSDQSLTGQNGVGSLKNGDFGRTPAPALYKNKTPSPAERGGSFVEGGSQEPSSPEEAQTPREAGTNPRAAGTNPRANGTNPRELGTNHKAQALSKERERFSAECQRIRQEAGLPDFREPLPIETLEVYRTAVQNEAKTSRGYKPGTPRDFGQGSTVSTFTATPTDPGGPKRPLAERQDSARQLAGKFPDWSPETIAKSTQLSVPEVLDALRPPAKEGSE